MKIAAVIPVFGRLPLTKYTIRRLLSVNKIDEVICTGHQKEDKKMCESEGAIWIDHENILSDKWNAGFRLAGERGADYVVFVGSSDWLCHNWIRVMIENMGDAGMIGKREFYCAHLEKSGNIRLGQWLGYNNHRKGELIGIGRILSRKALDRINWEPFLPGRRNNMDYMMHGKMTHTHQEIKLYDPNDIYSLSISTDFWGNMHRFGDASTAKGFIHYEDSQEFINNYFNQITQVYEECLQEMSNDIGGM